MGISYDEAVAAQARIEDELLKDPNVASVGVVEEVNDLGQKTGNYIIQVGVISVEAYRSTLKHGQSIIPQEYVLQPSSKMKEEKHIRINVVKEGKIEALSMKEEDLPSAMDEIQDASNMVGDTTARRRPSPCGQSIGHPNVTAGTMGLLVKYESGSNKGKAFILSNNHVLAANNAANVGDAIIQPGKYDSGVEGRDTIAHLYRWVPIDIQGFNYVDAAIAEAKGGLEWDKYVVEYVSKIGVPDDCTDAKIGMNVEKTGRTTGYTQGIVFSINETIKVNYPMGNVIFKNQIRATSMSKGGDSGSCLFEMGTKKPVGLLFAGSDTASFFNPLKTVLNLLSQSHTNKYPSGKTHVFPAQDPLTILKRPYTTIRSTSFFNQKTKMNDNESISLPKKMKPITSLFKTNQSTVKRNFSSEKSSGLTFRLRIR